MHLPQNSSTLQKIRAIETVGKLVQSARALRWRGTHARVQPGEEKTQLTRVHAVWAFLPDCCFLPPPYSPSLPPLPPPPPAPSRLGLWCHNIRLTMSCHGCLMDPEGSGWRQRMVVATLQGVGAGLPLSKAPIVLHGCLWSGGAP